MSHVRGYPLIKEALRRAGLPIPPDAEPPSKQARSSAWRPRDEEDVDPRPPLPAARAPAPPAAFRVPREAARFVSNSKSGASKKRVLLWYEQRGLCHYCKRPTVLFEPKPNARLPANAATLEHLRTRMNPERTAPARGERRIVMACAGCNTAKGREEQRAHDARLLPQELWRRNGNLFSIAKMSGALNEVDASLDRRRWRNR